ncbi:MULTISPECIES: PEP-CTERM sorting domain-containing protein [unclassified Duganella]|uniref:PEP-CTERM sorting domain-containing protein n=1 Tax=unclassified Duganella TaxID=2636909 RepID=UPI001E61DC30|nr:MULTISPECIES: PEP-CTERM sorting domain-containing protein [unclassified Duganella]
MNSIFRKMLLSLAATLALPLAAQASPITLNYSITGSTTYTYEFTLTLDNHDSSWAAGQNFNWFIFGDGHAGTPTPLTNFVGDPSSLPIGPFTSYNTSSGGHNGPTLLDYSNGSYTGWVPSAVGDALHWKGTSTASLGQGQLLWSNLAGNGHNASFEVGVLNAVPEPETYGMLLAGLALLGVAARRKSAV